MLDSTLNSIYTHRFGNNQLENCIKYCVNELKSGTSEPTEILRDTLERLELGVSQFAKKYKESIFRLLRSSKPIRYKKTALANLIFEDLKDILGATRIMTCFSQFMTHHKITDDHNYRCAERLRPLLECTKEVFNEILRINSYDEEIKDQLKYQMAILYELMGTHHYFMYNQVAAINEFSEMLTVADTISDVEIKESFLSGMNIIMFVDCYLWGNDLANAARILRMEREKCCAEAAKLYYERCVNLAKKYELQADYPNAINWLNEALELHESFDLTIEVGKWVDLNITTMEEYLLTIDREASITHEIPDLRNTKRRVLTGDFQITIAIAIPEWSSALMTRMQQLAGKFSLEFVPDKLTIHKASAVGVSGLTKILKAMHKLEKEYQKWQMEKKDQDSQQMEHALEELKSTFANLTISESSTSMVPSCSSEPVTAPNKPSSVKIKTRGKPQKRALRTATPLPPSCDAEKFGFSRSLFGMRAFHECRMRGDSSRVFYVVEGPIEESKKHKNNQQKFASLMAEPKIVPPCGEEGFKWMKINGRQVLVGKVLATKKRLFPTIAQRNDQGAIAFMYGKIVKTKNGIPEKCIQFYGAPSKQTRK